MTLRERAAALFRRISDRRDSGIPELKESEPHAFSAEFVHTGEQRETAAGVAGLSTFGGVFTPSFLTIIGVIMYLQFSWVLGNAGLWQSLLIVVLANLITFISALSVSSISSNERMETGGAYFMVSRVLGHQAGGGIGIPLYLSQTLSISLYIIGFSVSINNVFPTVPIQLTSFISLGSLTLLSFLGAKAMIRIQYLILGIILLSFVSIAAGFTALEAPVYTPAYQEGQNFWSVFAVFFPAVTGILAGVSMSGDLKEPAKSIPRGTLLAVGAGFLVYLLIPLFLAFSVPRNMLFNSSALGDAARWPVLVSLGVIGATISSAIGSLMAAPRTMQALAKDGILPGSLSRGVGKNSEPLPALGVSLVIAFVVLLLGDIQQIAGILTMFFLTTYGVLNFSAAMERFVGNPSFRPAIKIHWSVNLLGALGCFAAMFLISALTTVIALTLVALVFLLVGRGKSGPVGGQGLWEGFWTRNLFAVIHRLEKTRSRTGKNWRPMIQVFASEAGTHGELVFTAAVLTRRGGSLSAYAMVDPVQRQDRIRIRQDMSRMVSSAGPGNSFVTVVESDQLYHSVVVASQASGFAGALHNTVMLGLPSAGKADKAYLSMLDDLLRIDRNILLFRKGSMPWQDNPGPVIVWWGGQETNVRLMLTLGYLIQQNSRTTRELIVATVLGAQSPESVPETNTELRPEQSTEQSTEQRTEDDQKVDAELQNDGESLASEAARKVLSSALSELRLKAEIRISENNNGQELSTIIANQSKGAAMVLIGMAHPDSRPDFLENLRKVSEGIGATLFVRHNIRNQDYD